MNLLITAAASPLAQSLAAVLRREHRVRLTERIPVANVADFAQCPLNHDLSTTLLVCGMDAIVHVAEPLPTDNESQQIDYLTRCTYNLYLAAVAEGVKRVIFLSTLDLMTPYDPNYTVGERWRPLPTVDTPVLTKHLGEFVGREFAREHKLEIVVLRLGKVVQAEAVTGQAFDPLWVDERDVAQAITRALTTDTGLWSILHIQPDSPQARFSIATAKRVLGYAPAYNF
jgi:uronate dehydrogenase